MNEQMPHPTEQADRSSLDFFRNNKVAAFLAGLSFFGGAAGLAAEAASADVAPKTGIQYSPKALAQECVEDVGDGFSYGYTGEFHYTADPWLHRTTILGKSAFSMQVNVDPMQSRLWGSDKVPCPAPAGETMRIRVEAQEEKVVKSSKTGKKQLKVEYTPITTWQTVINNTTAGTTDANGNAAPVTINFNFKEGGRKWAYKCLPKKDEKILREEYKKAGAVIPRHIVSRLALRFDTQAHSLDQRGPHHKFLDDITFPGYFRDLC